MIQNHLGKANWDNNNDKFLFNLPVVMKRARKNVAICVEKLRAERKLKSISSYNQINIKNESNVCENKTEIEWEDDTWNHQMSVPIECDFSLLVVRKKTKR
jgi:hypothetical protein